MYLHSPRVQLPIAAHDHRDQFLKGSPGSCLWPKTKVKSLKVLIQPRGIGKDTLLLPNLSLNCSCTLQSRDWGMNSRPGSFNKVIKIFRDWLGELHPKSPTAQADVLSHHTAYLEVGAWVSLPPCFEKRSLLHCKEQGEGGLNVSFGGGMLLPAWPLCQTWKAGFHQICFRNCSPETPREERRRWKLKALFTFPVQLSETHNPQVP